MSRPRLRVVFFGSGGLLSVASLDALAREHDVVAAVRVMRRNRPSYEAAQFARRLRLLPPDPLADAARRLGVPQWPVRSAGDEALMRRLQAAGPDVLCAAHFPRRLPDPVLQTASFGGINLHPSLLPRHRGPLPLFWVYHAGDRQSGVTAHQMTNEFDSGDILGQRAVPLPRGYPADELNTTHARVGGELLAEVVGSVGRGDVARRPQREAEATLAPFVRPGQAMVDFGLWDVEQVWHFLAGVWPRFIEPIVESSGGAIRYAGVAGYEAGLTVGAVGRAHTIAADRLGLQCRDGVVFLRPERQR